MVALFLEGPGKDVLRTTLHPILRHSSAAGSLLLSLLTSIFRQLAGDVRAVFQGIIIPAALSNGQQIE